MTLPRRHAVPQPRSAPWPQVRGLPPARTRRDDRLALAAMHESVSRMHADRGQWRLAYLHLRAAADLRAEPAEPVAVPDQWRSEVSRLRRAHDEARELSRRDSLTDSYNRRYLDERLLALQADPTACADGIAVALVDVDWFKPVNDRYGHPFGDRVLQRIAAAMQQDLPPGGFCARYGGEEFVLVLPDLSMGAAIATCERARAAVQYHPWHQLAADLRVSVSIGVAHESVRHGPVDPEQYLLRADMLLYAAKRSGRNAVAYRDGQRVRLAGAASRRHGIVQPHPEA